MKNIDQKIRQIHRLRAEVDAARVQEIRAIQAQQIGLIIGFLIVAFVMAVVFVGSLM